MGMTLKADSVRFTTRGQVVIPGWLRKEFHIEDGTRRACSTGYSKNWIARVSDQYSFLALKETNPTWPPLRGASK